jgi:hypothetical protein
VGSLGDPTQLYRQAATGRLELRHKQHKQNPDAAPPPRVTASGLSTTNCPLRQRRLSPFGYPNYSTSGRSVKVTAPSVTSRTRGVTLRPLISIWTMQFLRQPAWRKVLSINSNCWTAAASISSCGCWF